MAFNKKVFFGNFSFIINENVYDPAEDSFLFAENLDVGKNERVLEIGTGSGILAILASRQASEVLAVDLNPYAIHCANQNAKLNKVSGKILFIRSDLLSSIRPAAKFDLILFNAPYVPSEENELDSWLGYSWYGGITGRQVMDRFISQASKYLQKSGKILFMQSTLTSVDETIEKFANYGLKAKIIATQSLAFFEKLILIRAQFT